MYFCLTFAPAAYSLVLVTRSCLAAEPAALHVFLHPCFSSVPSQQSAGHQAGCHYTQGQRHARTGGIPQMPSSTKEALMFRG